MRSPQTAFAIWYPFDNEVMPTDNLETALADIEENEKFVAEGVDSLGYTDVERYKDSYIVIWDGEGWIRYGL